ncbi:MAG: 2-phospho-L-lactate transferase [Anaerolineae bacterium]|nr:2-phospho-L-lactate transferase [Anaerolineae bacterium]
MKIVALVGGVGGAKLAHGLAQVLPPENLTVVVNTGDDFWLHGLRICPDFDTVMYTLGGVVDPVNGWGLRGDTVAVLGALERYGESPWFRLGDQDVATHLLRTEALRAGERLTTIMQRLTKALGIHSSILPMTDDEVSTIVDTIEFGRLSFQDYFVRHRWQPRVRSLHYDGVERATVTPEVVNAIACADAIMIGPSNPWLSLAPMLSMPGLGSALLARDVPRIAITPIVGGKAIKGPAAKLMAELGYEVSPLSVAEFYRKFINGFIYDEVDIYSRRPEMRHLLMNTIMQTDADRAALARQALTWIESELL